MKSIRWLSTLVFATALAASVSPVLSKDIPHWLQNIAATCLNGGTLPEDWQAIEPSESTLNQLGWAGSLTQHAGYQLTYWFQEDQHRFLETLREDATESWTRMADDVQEGNVRFFQNDQGWTAAVLLGSLVPGYYDDFGSCRIWHPDRRPEVLEWHWGPDYFDFATPVFEPKQSFVQFREVLIGSNPSSDEGGPRLEARALVFDVSFLPEAPLTVIRIEHVR